MGRAFNATGLCLCGCGGVPRIATVTDTSHGYVKGQPVAYINGHQRRGKTHTPESRAKMAIWSGTRGAETPAWKGAEAKYSAVHMWLSRNYPKSGTCDECGAAGRTEWANVSGDYGDRSRENWRELCRGCHSREDKLNPKRPDR